VDSIRYCALPTSIVPLGADRAVLCRLGDHHRMVVSCTTAKILHSCQELRTLEQHANKARKRALPNSGSAEKSSIDFHKEISNLIANGFIVQESSLPFAAPPDRSCEEGIRDVAIVTNNRPQKLREAMTSIIDNTRERSEPVTVTVYDDSPAADGYNEVVDMLRALKNRLQYSIRYSDRNNRLRYASLLSKESGVDKKILDFALNGPNWGVLTTGANRNSALLDLAGCQFVLCDDDIRARIVRSSSMCSGVTLSSRMHPVTTVVHDDFNTALSAAVFHDADVLAIHQKYLGKQIHKCILPLSDHLVHSDCAPEFWQSVLDGNGRISATQMGIIGNSGQSSPSWVLSVTGSERKAMVLDEQAYRLARQSKYVTRIADVFTISSSSFCMAYALGLNNQDSLPPFFPIGRNSDGVFGVALRVNDPHRFIGHLPFGVVHENPDNTPYSSDAIWHDSTRVRISDIAMTILRQPRSVGICENTAPNYVSLGERFIDIAQLDDDDLAESLNRTALDMFSQRMARYEWLLNKFRHEPALWAEDIEKAQEHILCAASDRYSGLPCDLGTDDPRNCIQRAREVFTAYGSLLQAWPTLRSTAQALAVRGLDDGMSYAL
jgi:hypothetical protein